MAQRRYRPRPPPPPWLEPPPIPPKEPPPKLPPPNEPPQRAASAGATEGPAAKAAAHGRTGRTPVVVPGRAGPVIAGAGAIARAVSGTKAGARRRRRAGTIMPTGRACHVAPCEGAPVPAHCMADGCNEHPEHEQYDDQHHHQGHEQDHDTQNDIPKGGGAVVRLAA